MVLSAAITARRGEMVVVKGQEGMLRLWINCSNAWEVISLLGLL